MPRLASFGLLLLGCRPDEGRPAADDNDAPSCGPGQLRDGSTCVPAACGTGTWGDLLAQSPDLFVDAAAPAGGDGSLEAPFSRIPDALDASADLAPSIAIAAGTYLDPLHLNYDQDGARLLGRCRELVILDGAAADEVPVIEVSRTYDLEIRGLTVDGGGALGLAVAGATMTLADAAIRGSYPAGISAYNFSVYQANLTVDGVLVQDTPQRDGDGGYGVYAFSALGTGDPALDLRESVIGPHRYAAAWLASPGSYTLADSDLSGGDGLALGGATLHGNAVYVAGVEGLALSGNTFRASAGAALFLDGASATLEGSLFADNALDVLQQRCADTSPLAAEAVAGLHSVLCPDPLYLADDLQLGSIYLEEPAVEP